MWSLQTPQLYDIFCISTNSACSSVFFQAWISTCHWTLLNASISIVDNLDMNSASHLHWDCSLLLHRSAATPQLRSVWDVWDLGMQVDKSSNLLGPTWDIAHNPLQHQPGNWKKENKVKQPKGKSCLSHSVILVARRCSVLGFCFATERLKPLVTMYEMWIWQYWQMYFILARWSTKYLGSTGPDRCSFGTGFMSRVKITENACWTGKRAAWKLACHVNSGQLVRFIKGSVPLKMCRWQKV